MSKPAEPAKAANESKEAEPEVAKEGLVKPSSFKRPRLPSGTPPKPAPRPDRKKEPKEEKKEEEKPEVKKEEKPEVKKEEKPKVEEAKPEVKEDKPEEKKDIKPVEKKEEEPDGKKEEEPEKEEKKEVVEDKEKPVEDVKKEEDEKKKEETQTNEKEEKSSEEMEEPKEVEQKVEDAGADTAVSKEVESTEKVDGKVPNGETQIEEKDDSEKAAAKDDLWVKRESGREALRPGGRSMSLKVQRSTSATEKTAPSLRSATLPKPWSPGQAPSSMLSRKLSWEMPKAGDEGVKKERSESSSEEPILEVSEDQNSKT